MSRIVDLMNQIRKHLTRGEHHFDQNFIFNSEHTYVRVWGLIVSLFSCRQICDWPSYKGHASKLAPRLFSL